MKNSTAFSDFEQRKRENPRRITERNRMRRIYHFDIWGIYGRMERSECKAWGKKQKLSRRIELIMRFGE